MTRPIGTVISPELIKRLRRAAVLEFFEGERLSLYRAPSGDAYFKIWFDVDGSTTQWWYVRLTDVDVSRFLRRRISLRQVLKTARDGFVYVVDTNPNGDIDLVRLAMLDTINETSLPTEHSLFDESLGFETPTDEHTVLIDGTWNASDFSRLEKRLSDVYSFLAPFGTGATASVRLKDAFTRFRYRGGWIQVLTFDRLSMALPREKRVELDAVIYASPGIVRFRVDPNYAARVQGALVRFGKNAGKAASEYKSLHDLLLEIGRVREASSEVEGKAAIAALDGQLAAPTRRLVDALGGIDLRRVREAADNDENTGQLVAAYYRRLVELYSLETVDVAEHARSEAAE